MAQAIALAAEVRERAGKGAARATRRAGRVPAVIYGNKMPPVMISLTPIDLERQLKVRGFFTKVFELTVGGETHRVLARDLQLDPVTDAPLHVDFMRFGATTRVTVDVQVIFINEDKCPGLRRGGVLNMVRRSVELVCLADAIPENLIADLEHLDIGDGVHISNIDLPEGVAPTISDRDFTIATIAAPTLLKTPEEEAAEAAAAEEDEAEGAEGGEAEGADKPEGGSDAKG